MSRSPHRPQRPARPGRPSLLSLSLSLSMSLSWLTLAAGQGCTQEVAPDRFCQEAATAIAGRTEACTGDLELADARYAAFDLAVKAARLLPNNDPAGGQILQYAGNLLKYREPKAANPAYTLLVTRFKETPYGAEALKRHWFSKDRPEPLADIISK